MTTAEKELQEVLETRKEEWVNIIIKLNKAPKECPELTEINFTCRADYQQEHIECYANLDVKEVIVTPVENN